MLHLKLETDPDGSTWRQPTLKRFWRIMLFVSVKPPSLH